MINKRIFSFIALLLVSSAIFATEVILQNGNNGYNGCTDTHLRTHGFEPPHSFWYDNLFI